MTDQSVHCFHPAGVTTSCYCEFPAFTVPFNPCLLPTCRLGAQPMPTIARRVAAGNDTMNIATHPAPTSLRAQAYENFQQQIVAANIRPGQFISQRELLIRHDLFPIPVRAEVSKPPSIPQGERRGNPE